LPWQRSGPESTLHSNVFSSIGLHVTCQEQHSSFHYNIYDALQFYITVMHKPSFKPTNKLLISSTKYRLLLYRLTKKTYNGAHVGLLHVTVANGFPRLAGSICAAGAARLSFKPNFHHHVVTTTFNATQRKTERNCNVKTALSVDGGSDWSVPCGITEK